MTRKPGNPSLVCGWWWVTPDKHRELEVQCHLDSGAEVSLFDGQIAHGIGLGLQRGDVQVFSASSGAKLAARLHRVRLRHEDLGEFELRVGFSESNSRANLLGRDFFNLFHVGFQERRSTLLFSPED